MSSTKAKGFYTTGRRNFSTAPWRRRWSRAAWSRAWRLQHYSWLFTIACLFTRLLVILSTFLLSCKASSPLTELVIVHTHTHTLLQTPVLDSDLLCSTKCSGTELEIPLIDYPNEDLNASLCENMHIAVCKIVLTRILMHWQCSVSQMCFSIYNKSRWVDAVKGLR